jgi:hypothetical protein
LRESGEFEGFVRNPPSGKPQPPSRGENVDPHGQRGSPSSPIKPVVLQFPKPAGSADSHSSFEIQKQPQSKSPYWFAKGN